uniref:Retrovirus-related Pol polyprotein from transposon TNT 1-94 n=1 Tax=Cajanus cajan TaxID=3821 RepID=A0A151RRS5_CAJCA|nr:Retrovirus-related Pol polyprotein from transposon TNT 1-94 [Cajanus cajan]
MSKPIYDTSNFVLPSSSNVNKDVVPRISKRIGKTKDFSPKFCFFLLENDPKTYSEAMRSIDTPFWKAVINDEIDSLKVNKTWFLIYLPPGCKSIGCKKLRMDGSIDKFKAKLIVIGYIQVEGVDLFDTYSPISKVTTIRVLIALACVFNLEIHQMDVKIAFLNGNLEYEI